MFAAVLVRESAERVAELVGLHVRTRRSVVGDGERSSASAVARIVHEDDDAAFDVRCERGVAVRLLLVLDIQTARRVARVVGSVVHRVLDDWWTAIRMICARIDRRPEYRVDVEEPAVALERFSDEQVVHPVLDVRVEAGLLARLVAVSDHDDVVAVFDGAGPEVCPDDRVAEWAPCRLRELANLCAADDS